jgi:hypothetical protein
VTLHVDIVRNDLSARVHECVAVVHMTEHGLKIDMLDEHIRNEIPYSVWDTETRSDVSRTSDPKKFLELLQYSLSGVTVYATAPHTDEACLFALRRRVAMTPDAGQSRLAV